VVLPALLGGLGLGPGLVLGTLLLGLFGGLLQLLGHRREHPVALAAQLLLPFPLATELRPILGLLEHLGAGLPQLLPRLVLLPATFELYVAHLLICLLLFTLLIEVGLLAITDVSVNSLSIFI